MPLPEIDDWTKRIVSLAAPDIRSAVGSENLGPELVNEVCLQVRDVIAHSAQAWPREALRDPSRIEQMAMAIYVAVAASDTPRGVAPSLLTSLKSNLGRALERGELDPSSNRSVRERRGDLK